MLAQASQQRSAGGAVWELYFYATMGLEGRKVGDLLRPEEQVVKGLDAILVLCEDWRHDICWLRREEHPLPAGLRNDPNEAFDLGNPRSGD